MSKKMTKQDLKNYIISEATKLYKIEVLKERKESIDKELKLLSEGSLYEYNSKDDDGKLVSDLVELLKQTEEGNNVIKNIGLDAIRLYSDNMYSGGNRHPTIQAKILIKNYGASDYENYEQKLERFKNSEYYLNGERVYPEINYYNNYLGAVLDDRFYKFDEIEGEKGKYSLREPKGRTGMNR